MSDCCDNKKDNLEVQVISKGSTNKFTWLALSLVIVIPLEFLSLMQIHLPVWIEIPLFVLMIAVFGRKVFLNGIRSLFKLRLSDINLLMTIACFGALYLREFSEAAVIVVLFALGEALEEYGVGKSQSALEELANKSPKMALLKDQSEKIKVEDVQVKDIVIIKPGDAIPLDGKVVVGSSAVDEAAITGEPLPKNKEVGDLVYAGTLNKSGYLEIEVLKSSKDSTLAKIIELTFSSAEKKSQSQKFIEKFSKYYTPSVIVISTLVFVIPVIFLKQDFNKWLEQALTLLIISCPCALVISTPISIFSAIGNATRKGILVKGGKYIEEISKIKAIALDKTRTLTKGEPIVSDIITFNNVTQEELLACAAGMEAFSEHPIAQSIVKKALELNIEPHKFSTFNSVMGKGIVGDCLICNTKNHRIGNIKFISEEQDITEEVNKKVRELENEGKTAIIMTDKQIIKGIIAVTDEIRPESKDLITQLNSLGIKSIILTGDNKLSAEYVANIVGIKEVSAGLLPDGKVEELERYKAQYQYVAMVGDGVNDAPALASSSVGIAMGAIGSDVAIENADIALMNDNLKLLPYLVLLSRKCVNKIKFNITLAVSVKVIFLALALFGIGNLALAIFADVGMTVLVIFNSLRLFNYKLKEDF